MTHDSNTIDIYLSRHICCMSLNGDVASVKYGRENGVNIHGETADSLHGGYDKT